MRDIWCAVQNTSYLEGELKMKVVKRILIAVVILMGVFLFGRHGWKTGGFNACQGAGINLVEVGDSAVHIDGFYPGSFPEGFCGYIAEEKNVTLYVGFHFSALFGFFDTGDFDINIPIKERIDRVIMKTGTNETVVWTDTEAEDLEVVTEYEKKS